MSMAGAISGFGRIDFSFLKRNLVGRAEFELTCVVTHLSIQGVPQLTKEKT